MRSLRIRYVIVGLGLLVLGGCVSAPREGASREDATVARIEVVDRPNYRNELYRYIAWRGEKYGPTAFEGVAKGKVKLLVLSNATEPGVRCVAALARALAASAMQVDPISNVSREIAPSTEDVTPACEIPYEVPRPELGAGQYYVSSRERMVAIDGEPFRGPDQLVARLTSIGATAIVLRKATIGQLFCFGAIANEAGVKLLEVERDGSLSEMSVGGQSLSKACSW